MGTPLLVISPHLDDAVLSAGCLLAAHPGSIVATVLTASRPTGHAPTEWDEASGLARPGIDPPTIRRREDRRALSVLGAVPCWLDLLEGQYGGSVDVDLVQDALAPVLDAYGDATPVMPLGLWHSEHTVVHEACRRLCQSDPSRSWLAYADIPYRRVDGGRHLTARLLDLRQRGLHLIPQPVSSDGMAAKRSAVARYPTQLRALAKPGKPGWRDALQPEQCWRIDAVARQRPSPAHRSDWRGRPVELPARQDRRPTPTASTA